MKVSPASDIVGIASSFGVAAHQYKEIKRDEDAYEIAQRWPMLAELHGFAPAPADEAESTVAVADSEAAPASAPLPRDKSGLKVVAAASQNADADYTPTAPPAQIAA